MPVERLLETQDAEFVARMRAFAHDRLAPAVDEAEATSTFPRELLRDLGRAGLASLPYPLEFGGGGRPYEAYLQALEELAGPWLGVGVACSVHALSCWALNAAGTEEQKRRLLPGMLGGDLLGGYALSEAGAGSDVASMTTRATRDGDDYLIAGDKMWIGHSGFADYFTTFARTDDGAISCFYVPASTPGISYGPPTNPMAMRANAVGRIHFDAVRVPATNRIGAEGQGMRLALGGLDAGRLGIAAVATGVAQAALDHAVAYAAGRVQFGQPVAEFQGLQFLLADMAAAVESARATYLHAARLRDAGRPFTRQAAIAKLVATDGAMRVCTDAVQVLGGAGFTLDHPVERYFREVKATQIFEGTNQIQRLVIARSLLADLRNAHQ